MLQSCDCQGLVPRPALSRQAQESGWGLDAQRNPAEMSALMGLVGAQISDVVENHGRGCRAGGFCQYFFIKWFVYVGFKLRGDTVMCHITKFRFIGQHIKRCSDKMMIKLKNSHHRVTWYCLQCLGGTGVNKPTALPACESSAHTLMYST